jgi:chromosome segregation ATPase
MMATVETIESLQATLEPLEDLHGHHSQLEAWVNESFAALENLHQELAAWQSELARKQTELDLREDQIDRSVAPGIELSEQMEVLKKELEEAREEILQLEDESGEQLQELERIEKLHAKIDAELKAAQHRIDELKATLAQERIQAARDQEHWKEELRDMRRMMERQFEKFSSQPESAAAVEHPPALGQEEGDATRTAELRRRAEDRRAKRRNRDQEGPAS